MNYTRIPMENAPKPCHGVICPICKELVLDGAAHNCMADYYDLLGKQERDLLLDIQKRLIGIEDTLRRMENKNA